MAQKKLVLDTSAMQEDFFADAALVGVGTPVPIYRFCWLLERHFGLTFQREPEMDVVQRHKRDDGQEHFPLYQHQNPLEGAQHYLYGLRSRQREVLLPEVKTLDFLWMIQTAQSEEDADRYAELLRTLPDIQLATVILPDHLKHKANLLL